jgi:hypothetical protein
MFFACSSGCSGLLRVEEGALDLARFELLIAEARTSLPARRVGLLLAALSLWRGPPLAKLAYNDVAKAEIARLEALRLTAFEERIDAELELGRHAELVPELEQLVTAEPLRERLRRQLMLPLYRAGRQADALAAYADARRTLVHELGIEPGPALKELERAILAQDPALEQLPAPAPDPSAEPLVEKPPPRVGTVTLLAAVLDPDATDPAAVDGWRALADALRASDADDVVEDGDVRVAVFATAASAVAAAERLAGSVRVGLHTGSPTRRDRGYEGDDVERSLAIAAAAHPGQLLLSAAKAALVRGAVLRERWSLHDAGDDPRVRLRAARVCRRGRFDRAAPHRLFRRSRRAGRACAARTRRQPPLAQHARARKRKPPYHPRPADPRR